MIEYIYRTDDQIDDLDDESMRGFEKKFV